jgi:hypothetical protein
VYNGPVTPAAEPCCNSSKFELQMVQPPVIVTLIVAAGVGAQVKSLTNTAQLLTDQQRYNLQ